jgi:uncharacterized membrane protein YfcA
LHNRGRGDGAVTFWQGVLVFVAGIGAGTLNTVVGSGTLLTFPALLAIGLSPVTANVSNTVGLTPGSLSGAIGYRAELEGQRRRTSILATGSVLGGIIGAVLLLTLPEAAFRAIVPVLIGIALVLVIVQPWLSERLAAGTGADRTEVTPALWIGVFLTGIYGGYFGAAQGVLLLAIMGVLLTESLQRINAVKNVLALLANAVAAVVFVFAADVDWMAAGLVAVGAVIGGQLGARVGRRLPPAALRAAIVVVGLAAIAKIVFW